MSAHLIDGEFQSDKYPTCPRGKVPLSVNDETAQDLLWEYAQRRRAVDAEFADDLEAALLAKGFSHARTKDRDDIGAAARLLDMLSERAPKPGPNDLDEPRLFHSVGQAMRAQRNSLVASLVALEAENAELRADLQDALAAVGPEIAIENMEEGPCLLCGSSVDTPHTWKACAEESSAVALSHLDEHIKADLARIVADQLLIEALVLLDERLPALEWAERLRVLKERVGRK